MAKALSSMEFIKRRNYLDLINDTWELVEEKVKSGWKISKITFNEECNEASISCKKIE